MSKMLDIFEFALNLFNFVYVRLDGSTKVLLFFICIIINAINLHYYFFINVKPDLR